MNKEKFIISLLCFILICSSGGLNVSADIIMNAYKPVGNIASGEYVVINNESIEKYDYQESGTVNNGEIVIDELRQALSDSSVDGTYKIDINRPMPSILKEKALDSSSIKNNIKFSNAYAVGDTKLFHVVDNQTDEFYMIKAKLLYSGSKCDVWVNDSRITNDIAKKMGEEFDSKIYQSVVNNFASPGDIDGNGKINLLCYDIEDGYKGYGGYIAGYFSSLDLFSESTVQEYLGSDSHSNEGEILYIDTYPGMYYTSTDTVNYRNACETIAHEFQHLVNCYRNEFIEAGDSLPIWIDEGLAEAATQIYTGKVNDERIYYYNNSNDIKAGYSLTNWHNSLSNYSLSYLFFQYLKIQSGKGDAIFKEIIQSEENTYKSVEDVIKKYINPNMTLGRFTTMFRMALTLNESSGRYGFKGVDGFEQIKPNIYSDYNKSLLLESGGSITIKLDDSKYIKIPSDKGKDIKYVGNYDTYVDEDVNMDRIVNIKDLSTVARLYNTSTYKSNWYRDVNKDGYFDLYDLAKIARKIK